MRGAGDPAASTRPSLVEILDAWMRWPFRPTYSQLLSRTSDDNVTDAASEDVDESMA